MTTKLVFYSVYVVIIFVSSVCNKDIGSETKLGGTSQLEYLKARKHPTSEFSRHSLVKPKIYHGREKRQIATTLEESGEHTNHLQITLEVDGKDVILDLTLNKHLLPKGFFHNYQQNGQYKIHQPSVQDANLCEYNGKIRGVQNSWAAISTCDGLSGVIFDGREIHYIEKGSDLEESDIESEHFLYRHSDLAKHNKSCGYGGDAVDPEKGHIDNRILRYKRDTDQNELVRGPYNANKESKYVELVLVMDNLEYKELGESTSKVINHAKTIANIINALYSPLNIFIALVGVVIWTEKDEIDFSSNGDTTLTNFLHYRREALIKIHPNDNAQLLTKVNFDNGVVGKALKGPICTYEFSGGVNTDHSTVVGLVATTVAHEMGHNFGMEHDNNECKCPEDRCIMAPSSSTVAPTHWSSCSLNYLLQAFTQGMDYCLKNKPTSLFDSPVCGNGFVEPGEQCDCGMPEHCDNFCCNATTCMLHSNASCATGECCDLTTCLPKGAGTLCRSADYECDLPEYCTGQSEYCPADIFKLDTEVCDGGKAYCYHGFCRTRTDQCKLLWGETGKSSDDQCYLMNTKGTQFGNCGYNRLTQSYYKCSNESVLCGMLHCKHLNERLEFGMESVSKLSHSFINKKGSIIPCRNAIIDLGINQVDPGLTPDGAICGEDKMCVNQKCMSVSSLRKAGPSCPEDCNGNGWCNSKGHCHCKDGFAPPHCDYPGPGGSMDSGPASDPDARQGIVAALFIIFLGIVPLLAIIALLSYYARHNFKFGWKKSSPTTTKSPNKSRGPSFPTETAKRTEDNHSLLREDSPPPIGFSSAFFGNFKGFSITPNKSEPAPVRAAPPPPAVPRSSATLAKTPEMGCSKSSFFDKPIQKYNSFRNSKITNGIAAGAGAPALPPPNPGSHPRPIISSPVLENSTCTAKELISPLRNAPKLPIRAAPEAPAVVPVSQTTEPTSTTVLSVKITEEPKKLPKEGNTGTLNRITSFLKPADKKTVARSDSTLKRNQVKANKVLDKDALRAMKISDPIPQTNIEIAITALPVEQESTKSVVMRAQSMRAPKDSPRPNIQTFGSMRQPSGFKRPLSIPSASRPKSPPPPRPPGDKTQSQYDDCLNKAAPLGRLSETSPSGDNIYAVILENPVSPPQDQQKPSSNSGSSENMGLLGEIVSEIQNRNFDSIYSTSTLARKKKEAEDNKKKEQDKVPTPPDSETYVNTASLLYSDSEYSNMSGNLKSSASSTSSGYILPSAVNVPVKPVEKPKDERPKSGVSSFKVDNAKPFASTFARPQGPLASNYKAGVKKVETSPERSKLKTPPSPTKPAPKPINRQITPPNLRTRKPSPSRAAPPVQISNRSVTNSPDLVTSCNSNPASKPPDVLGGNPVMKKPSIASVKPNVNLPRAPLKGSVKTAGIKSGQDKKSDLVKTPTAGKVIKTNSSDVVSSKTQVGVRKAARSSSNVASLQQKFETKSDGDGAVKAKT
ncbi:disintegrin and metalloproteinase domain-containing protein meltrin isoform X1 [Leptinotarsa decemlineata]|uniref:disintegrin and metalloproteinase domain-containing protein meltrin isoform X1 n=1 Tax=Leptinotarsa decemlineata TaxID=7539 RepID=UPI003D30871C